MAKESDTSSRKNSKTMRKIIFVMNILDAMSGLKKGKRIEGALYVDKGTGLLTFKPYFRKTPRHAKDRLLRYLEHGWVKESTERIKVYESLPKRLGAVRMAFTLDRESREAADVILEHVFSN